MRCTRRSSSCRTRRRYAWACYAYACVRACVRQPPCMRRAHACARLLSRSHARELAVRAREGGAVGADQRPAAAARAPPRRQRRLRRGARPARDGARRGAGGGRRRRRARAGSRVGARGQRRGGGGGGGGPRRRRRLARGAARPEARSRLGRERRRGGRGGGGAAAARRRGHQRLSGAPTARLLRRRLLLRRGHLRRRRHAVAAQPALGAHPRGAARLRAAGDERGQQAGRRGVARARAAAARGGRRRGRAQVRCAPAARGHAHVCCARARGHAHGRAHVSPLMRAGMRACRYCEKSLKLCETAPARSLAEHLKKFGPGSAAAAAVSRVIRAADHYEVLHRATPRAARVPVQSAAHDAQLPAVRPAVRALTALPRVRACCRCCSWRAARWATAPR